MPPDPTNPRRLFTKGRVTLGIALLLIVGLILAHVFWTNYERNRLLAAIQRYRDAGEPVLPEDFAPSVGDEPGDPVPEWRAAAAAVHELDRDSMGRADWISVPLTPEEDQRLRQVLEPNQSALAHARAASELHGRADWKIRMVSPSINVLLPDLNKQRELAQMLRRAALDAHFRHDDAEAVERIRQIVAQSHAMQMHPSLVAHLVAIGIEALACDTAKTIGSELQIGGASGAAGHPATPEQVRILIAELLDDRPLREGQVLAYRTERMFEVDTVMQVATSKLSIGGPNVFTTAGNPAREALGYLLAPRFYADGRLMLERTTEVLKAAQAPDWPDSQARLNALPSLEDKRGMGHVMLSVLMPAFNRAIMQDFRCFAEKRMTALLLACRWYGVDHGGDFPQSLDELVPAYLPAVPSDPFTSGSALRYRSGADPVVYSVGENGQDDGGSEQPTNPHVKDNHWEELDVVTHLKLQPHAAPPFDPQDSAPPPTTAPSTAPTTVPANP